MKFEAHLRVLAFVIMQHPASIC